MWRSLENIYRLGIKELISLRRDPVLLVFVFYALTLQIVIAGEGLSFQGHCRRGPFAGVPLDRRRLSPTLFQACAIALIRRNRQRS
jgi:ABC-2 type transport system permease protein